MEQALNWALYAASGLLALYAVRVLLQKKDPDFPGAQMRFGCGFYFLACVLAAAAARNAVGGPLNAVRLGAGAFLLAPAVGALTKTHGSRLVLGVVALFLSVLLAGPVVKDLWGDAQARIEGGPRLELQDAIADLETADQKLSGRLDDWRQRDLELRGRIRQAGYASYDDLAADADGLALLTELESVQGKIAWAEGEVAKVSRQLEAARGKLASLDEAKSDADDLQDLGLQVPDVSNDAYLTPVEQYARQKELEELFQKEFGKGE